MHRPLRLLLASCLVIGFGADAASATTARELDDGALVLASLAPESGDLSPLLRSLRAPVELAIEEINAAGGVGGSDVQLVLGDEGADAATARASVERFASEGVDAIIGPATSETTLAVLGSAEKHGIPMCSGSDALAPIDDDDLFFRTAPPSRLQGLALGELVLSDGHRRVAILRRRDFFGNQVAKALAQQVRRGGGRVVANVAYDPATSDFGAPVRRSLARQPDAIAVLGYDVDGAAVVRTLFDEGVTATDTAIYVPDTMQRPDFGSAVDASDPSAVAGIKGTAPATAPYNVQSPFHERFAATGIDPVFSSHYYDCTILTALAALRAESDDPEDLRDAFVDNVRGDEDCNTFADCRRLLRRGDSIHWRGASSNFDQYGDFEPEEGVFDTWSYDASGAPVTADASEQLAVASR